MGTGSVGPSRGTGHRRRGHASDRIDALDRRQWALAARSRWKMDLAPFRCARGCSLFFAPGRAASPPDAPRQRGFHVATRALPPTPNLHPPFSVLHRYCTIIRSGRSERLAPMPRMSRREGLGAIGLSSTGEAGFGRRGGEEGAIGREKKEEGGGGDDRESVPHRSGFLD